MSRSRREAPVASQIEPAPPGFPAVDARTVVAGGIRTRYLDEGDGAPVLLVHGSGAGVTALANWWPNIGPLSTGFRVLAPELAGFGGSECGPDLEYGIELWVRHVGAFLDALGIPRAHLVGNSLGGWVALEFARAHPGRVDRLVLMGTGGTPRSSTPLLRKHQGYRPGVASMRAVLEGFVHDPRHITDELVAYRYGVSAAAGAAEAYTATSAARNRDRVERPIDAHRAGQVAARTLLVHGRDDRIIPAESSWQLAHWLPHADLHLIGGCGHWSQIEHADLFNRLVRDFLTR
jgi:2-hydroxymuconate-semialdehyde hydrolase